VIDLHAHILPGLDDGPATLEESLAMARAYVDAGFGTVVATPHVIPGLYEPAREEILDGVQRLQAALEEAGIPLAVLPGAEYHLTPDLPRLLDAGALVTLNATGRYLLVELPFHGLPAHAHRTLFELLVAGVTPVIAHPERNDILAGEPCALAEMVERGVRAQVTAASLLGLFGSQVRRAAQRFVREGLAQLVATDAHGPDARLEAGPRAAQLLGDLARRLMRENPAAVLRGDGPEMQSFGTAGSRVGLFSRIIGKMKRV